MRRRSVSSIRASALPRAGKKHQLENHFQFPYWISATIHTGDRLTAWQISPATGDDIFEDGTA